MRKKFFAPFLFFLSLLVFTACSNGNVKSTSNTMYIEPAALSKEEKNIAKLYGNENPLNIFDFAVDNNIKTIQISLYHLEDGKWESKGSDFECGFSDKEGRIAFDYDKLEEDFSVSVQSKNQEDISSYYKEADKKVKEESSRVTSYLTEQTPIEYDKEIPLVIQATYSKDEINSYNITQDTFDHPENYAKQNYDAVYMLAIKFSKN